MLRPLDNKDDAKYNDDEKHERNHNASTFALFLSLVNLSKTNNTLVSVYYAFLTWTTLS